jgi:hypothetical protein
MSFIDAREHIDFRYINTLLLDVAKNPGNYYELVYRHIRVAPGLHPSQDPYCSVIFVKVSQQACASIVMNCASKLWSVMAKNLLALEPSNALTEDVRGFIKEERFANIRFFEHYFKVCKRKFRGTKINDNLKFIYELRDAIVHDKPNESNADIDQEIEQWLARLQPRIKDAELRWLPEIPTLSTSGHPFPACSTNALMMVMRYPVAKWVVDTTEQICSELDDMMFNHIGDKRLTDHVLMKGVPISFDVPLTEFLRIGGRSVQKTIVPPENS